MWLIMFATSCVVMGLHVCTAMEFAVATADVALVRLSPVALPVATLSLYSRGYVALEHATMMAMAGMCVICVSSVAPTASARCVSVCDRYVDSG